MDVDALVSGLVAHLDKVEQDARKRGGDPEVVPEAELHDREKHPAWEYADTEGGYRAEPVRPEGEGWSLNVVPSMPEGRYDYGGDHGPWFSEWTWRRLRPEGRRDWHPEGDHATVLGLVRATRDLIAQWRAARGELKRATPYDAGYHFAMGAACAAEVAVLAVARGWGVTDDKEDRDG